MKPRSQLPPMPTNPGLANETPERGWKRAKAMDPTVADLYTGLKSPAEVFHVGEYIRDEMIERGMTPADMQRATGISYMRWVLLRKGKVGLRGAEAEALERIGWGSALTWMAINLRWKKAQK